MALDKERDKDKIKAMDLAVSQIERQFGKGSIMKLGGRDKIDVPVIPTTSLSVDYALGVGGIPRGRITEILGAPTSGKATLALKIIAQVQKRHTQQFVPRKSVGVLGALIHIEDHEVVHAQNKDRVRVAVEKGAVFFL